VVIIVTNEKIVIPIWEKYLLTTKEAVNYFNIGEKKLRKIIEDYFDNDFALMNGTKCLIKRKKFEEFLDRVDVI